MSKRSYHTIPSVTDRLDSRVLLKGKTKNFHDSGSEPGEATDLRKNDMMIGPIVTIVHPENVYIVDLTHAYISDELTSALAQLDEFVFIWMTIDDYG